MAKFEEIRRLALLGQLGQEGLRRLDDLKAIEAMEDAHRAYLRVQRLLSEKEKVAAAHKAAATDMMRLLRVYGELHTTDAPEIDEEKYRRWII